MGYCLELEWEKKQVKKVIRKGVIIANLVHKYFNIVTMKSRFFKHKIFSGQGAINPFPSTVPSHVSQGLNPGEVWMGPLLALI